MRETTMRRRKAEHGFNAEGAERRGAKGTEKMGKGRRDCEGARWGRRGGNRRAEEARTMRKGSMGLDYCQGIVRCGYDSN